tara:strand:- start:893 stop:1030 length:138 start_codon:yes stop_codon:yes gene_type:complete
MRIVFIKDYLTYKEGFEFEKIDDFNGKRLIDLGVAKKATAKKSKK